MKLLLSFFLFFTALSASPGITPTNEIFSILKEKGSAHVVYCYTNQCSYCKVLYPKLKKASLSTNTQVHAVNLDTNPQFKSLYRIKRWPTILIIKNYRSINRVQDSSMSVKALENLISKK